MRMFFFVCLFYFYCVCHFAFLQYWSSIHVGPGLQQVMTRDQVEGNLLTEEEEEEEEEEEAECIQIGCSGGRERNTALAAALPAAPSLSRVHPDYRLHPPAPGRSWSPSWSRCGSTVGGSVSRRGYLGCRRISERFIDFTGKIHVL